MLDWYQHHGRKDLPWKKDPTPYRVWVSEVMLQQTQVARVMPYFEAFTSALPDIQSLALAPLDQVLHLWSGLGYYSRARNLHKAAQIIMEHHDGQFPQSLEEAQALPGLGRSSAGAILGFALGKSHAILDGNVKRILCRAFSIPGWPGQVQVERELWSLAEHLTPKEETANYNQAMMDLGATLCRRYQPDCPACPIENLCQARALNQTHLHPAPRPTKTKPKKQLYFLLITDDQGQILLEQRPPTGIWASLWSLPEHPLDRSPEAYLQATFGLQTQARTDLAPMRHSFSHYDLDIYPIHLRVSEMPQRVQERPWLWYNLIKPQPLGLPAPVLELISQLQQQGPTHGKNGPMY